MRRQKLGTAGLILIIMGMLAGCAKSAGEIAASGDGTVGDASPETGKEEDGESGAETSSWREAVQKMFEDP